jgi:hypothetical protein
LGGAISSRQLPLFRFGQHRRLDRDRQLVDLTGENERNLRLLKMGNWIKDIHLRHKIASACAPTH